MIGRGMGARLVTAYALMALVPALTLAPASGAEKTYAEAPGLAAKVAEGALPPVAERLPDRPYVTPGVAGRYGGELRMLIAKARDVRLFGVYGYARLVGYDTDYSLGPDILEDLTVEDGRIFTLKLRSGHKWSDGHSFTSEDFRYYWEDVANNPILSPAGPPRLLLVDGQPPRVSFPDALTIRYEWSRPNPEFLHTLARARPLFLYRPAHYLKRFHIRYGDTGRLQGEIAAAGVRNWAELHNRLDNMYKFDNVDLPTLQPWVNRTAAPATRFRATRNPYYHRVDPDGRQLPYIDGIIFQLTDSNLIAAKAGAGEVNLQLRGLSFSDVTFLKQGEDRHGFETRLWRLAEGSHLALYPNLNHRDPVWSNLFRNVNFRRALSLAIDRELINQSLYFGLALPGNNTVQKESPLYDDSYRTAWTDYDPEQANRLLDELGLDQRNSSGTRLFADGRALDIIVETAGESSEQTDVLELIAETWAEVGIKLYTRPLQRNVLRNRVYAGETLMSVWGGMENGVPTADMSPGRLAPTVQEGYMWPRWGQYYETNGKTGEAPDMAEARELLGLYESWLEAVDSGTRAVIWRRMLEIHADRQFSIGIVSGVLQPVVVSHALRNVPKNGVLAWDPGALIGVYRPDTFWFDSATPGDAP